jgi:tRNA1Val (adenine37-N6)-methyltransferase
MSKNSNYSYDYHQPDEYRFSLDSVFLAQKVAETLRATKTAEEKSKLSVMDLCSGCGIIGMELKFHVPEITNIDFVEIQDVYLPFFEKNREMIKLSALQFRFLSMNYQELSKGNQYENVYDLILCNPPYFFLGEGLLSPNEFKNRCRFFIDSNFHELMKSIHHCLKPGGEAFVLVRPGEHHGRNLFTEWENFIKLNKWNASAEIVDEVRGTNIICVRKEV